MDHWKLWESELDDVDLCWPVFTLLFLVGTCTLLSLLVMPA